MAERVCESKGRRCLDRLASALANGNLLRGIQTPLVISTAVLRLL